jgi:CubicO group peptidase (beta-lactamase class C family)
VTEFVRTLDRMQQQLDDGLFTRGAQIAVEVEGVRLLDVAIGDDGTGAAMTPEHVFRVYCTIKPFTAVAVARLVDRGEADLDAPLRATLPDLDVLGDDVTLAHVLTHTAGLQRPMAVEMELVPAGRRRAAVARAPRPPGWRIGADAAYSEYAGWQVLGWFIEATTGDDLREHLRRHVFEPAGLDATWIGMTRDEFATVLPRLGVNADMRNLSGFPMLFERSVRVCTETNVAHGGYTTARDLARFYSVVLDGRRSDREGLPRAATLQRFTSTRRPPVYDQVLARECAYGYGFMTELDAHAFGDRIGAASFGHSGNVGSSFAFADPDRELAVGVVFNGLVGHEAAFLRRRALVNALYADLDEAGVDASGEHDATGDVAPGRSRFRLRRRARS